MCIVVPESRMDELRSGYSELEVRKAAALSEIPCCIPFSQLDFSVEFLLSF